jgi:archaemetzincin
VGNSSLRILIAPVGPVDAWVLKDLSQSLGKNFPGKTISVSQEISLPDEAYDLRRRQYNSSKLLMLLSSLRLSAERILGITEADLYAGGLNYVFGEGVSPGQVCVVSTHRLRPENSGDESLELFSQRLIKEATHELGHTFSLGHCRDSTCVMYFSNSIVDTDRKSSNFCDLCRSRIEFIELRRSFGTN